MLTVIGGEHDLMPPLPPEQVNVMVTGELFQPAAFGGGATAAVIAGGLLVTNVSDTLVVELFPALSVAVPPMI